MAANPQLRAQPRTVIGKKVKQLRRAGLLPGIVYGPAVDTPRPVSVPTHEFDRLYRQLGSTTLVDLAIDGTTQPVFIREVERDALGKELQHVNFYAPNLNEPTVVNVHVALVGELPDGVGVLTHGRQEIEIRALPDKIPPQIEVDISQLREVGQAILVADLPVPEGCEILTPGDEMVVQVGAAQAEIPAPQPSEVLAEELGDQPAALREGGEPLKEKE